MALCYKLIRPPDKSAYWIINFLIAQPRHMFWILKRTVLMRRFFEHPKHMFKLTDKEMNAILGVLTILIRTYV